VYLLDADHVSLTALRHTRGVLAKYAALVSSSSLGAVTDLHGQ
jgi:hypothetical protein